jgi:hypothetical protein
MIENNKYREMDALAKITVNRILEQVIGDVSKSRINDITIFNHLKNKWNPQVKALYLTVFTDFQSEYQDTLARLHR